eukprot:867341-Rhodomonas_salina.1
MCGTEIGDGANRRATPHPGAKARGEVVAREEEEEEEEEEEREGEEGEEEQEEEEQQQRRGGVLSAYERHVTFGTELAYAMSAVSDVWY